MWYFTWILGLGFAVAVAILNAMWLELMADEDQDKTGTQNDRQNEHTS